MVAISRDEIENFRVTFALSVLLKNICKKSNHLRTTCIIKFFSPKKSREVVHYIFKNNTIVTWRILFFIK